METLYALTPAASFDKLSVLLVQPPGVAPSVMSLQFLFLQALVDYGYTLTNLDIDIDTDDTFESAFGRLQGQINQLRTNLYGESRPVSVPSFLRLSGGTLTGPLNFSGTTNSGLRVNNLTSAQRTALTPLAGMVVFNTTTNVLEYRDSGAWVAVGTGSGSDPTRVLRAGDLMTGPLGLVLGSVSAPGLYFTASTNTGFFKPAATNDISVTLIGTERARFTDAGGLPGIALTNYLMFTTAFGSAADTFISRSGVRTVQLGVANNASLAYTLRNAPSTSTNIPGGALTIQSGSSTGSAKGGVISFQISPAGGSGSSVNAPTNMLVIESGKIGFHGVTPVVRSAAYTVSGSVSPDRAYNNDSFTLNELGNVMATLISDLKATGIIG